MPYKSVTYGAKSPINLGKVQNMKNITCCFTGHRKLPPDKYNDILQKTRKQIEIAYRDGYRRFLCGGALGYDTMCAQEIIRMKKTHPDIKLILVYPCLGQDAKWQEKDRETYRAVFEECDECYCMSKSYTPYCMHLRNRAMIIDSSLCIAYLESDKGGTAYTYSYAAKHGVRTVNVAQINGGEHE